MIRRLKLWWQKLRHAFAAKLRQRASYYDGLADQTSGQKTEEWYRGLAEGLYRQAEWWED